MKKTASLLERYVAVAERFAWLEGKFYCNRLREFQREEREKRRKEWEARPFSERLPTAKRGSRKKKKSEEIEFLCFTPKALNKIRYRMIVDELIRRNKATARPIVDKVNPERSLCYELANEIGRVRCTLEEIYRNRNLYY